MTFIYRKPPRRRSLLLARAAYHLGHAWSYVSMLSVPARMYWDSLDFIWLGLREIGIWRFARYDAFDKESYSLWWSLWAGPMLVRRWR